LQTIQQIETENNEVADIFAQYFGFDGEDKLYLMVHSGSRGLGKTILDKHLSKHHKMFKANQGIRFRQSQNSNSNSNNNGNSNEIEIENKEFVNYLYLHNSALLWAKRNRYLIDKRFIQDMFEIECDISKDMTENANANIDENENANANETKHRTSTCRCIIDISHNFLQKKHQSYFPSLQKNDQNAYA
jgi:RNA-splicing ligase RtcB